MKDYLLSVIQERRRGIGPTLTKGLLSVASLGYRLGHGLHRMSYEMNLLPRHRLPVPVLSVGNITTGGTGKTPLVEALVRRLSRRNLRTTVLARGYGRIADGGDDESFPESAGLKNAIRIADPDRVMAGRRAIVDFKPDAILLDDGFQHYRLHRDLEIVAVDATNPLGNGRMIPRGFLRDTPSALRRAHVIVLTHVDQITPAELAALRDRVTHWSADRPIVESVHRPVSLRLLWNKTSAGLDWLRERRIYGFCGLGNPEAYRRTLETAGAEVVKFRAFPDHHQYTPQDLRHIEAEAQEFMATALVTTEKDATKLGANSFSLPLAALKIDLEIVRGDDRLESLLDSFIHEGSPAVAATS